MTVVWRFYDSVSHYFEVKKMGNGSNGEDACKQDNNFMVNWNYTDSVSDYETLYIVYKYTHAMAFQIIEKTSTHLCDFCRHAWHLHFSWKQPQKCNKKKAIYRLYHFDIDAWHLHFFGKVSSKLISIWPIIVFNSKNGVRGFENTEVFFVKHMSSVGTSGKQVVKIGEDHWDQWINPVQHTTS